MSRTFRNVKVRNPYVVPSRNRKAGPHKGRRRRESPLIDESGEPITPFYEPETPDELHNFDEYEEKKYGWDVEDMYEYDFDYGNF